MKSLKFKRVLAKALSAVMIASVVSYNAIPVKAAANDLTFTILDTSDLHGTFQNYNYSTNAATNGSLASAVNVIKKNLDPIGNNIVLDLGDTIQGNGTESYIGNSSGFPVVNGFNVDLGGTNTNGFDAVVFGNHEFNYSVDNIEKAYSQFKGKILCGNVVSKGTAIVNGSTVPSGSLIPNTQSYFIKTLPNGLKVAVIGMTHPNIAMNNPDITTNAGWNVQDVVTATRKAINDIEANGGADVYIAAEHLSDSNSELAPNDVAQVITACPEISVFLGAHGHTVIGKADNQKVISGTKFVENQNAGMTIGKVVITAHPAATQDTKTGSNYTIDKTSDVQTDVVSSSIKTAGVTPDAGVVALTAAYDAAIKALNQQPIGLLEGNALVPNPTLFNSSTTMYPVFTQPNGLIKLINSTQLKYSGADVAGTAPLTNTSNCPAGTITRANLTQIYNYDTNLLYRLNMTGAQLKAWMEWGYGFFYQGNSVTDLTPAYGTMASYNADQFTGVNYTVDLSKPIGQRINITSIMKDGAWTAFSSTQTYKVAANDFRTSNQLTVNDTNSAKRSADGGYSSIFPAANGVPAVDMSKDVTKAYNHLGVPDANAVDNILSLLTAYIQSQPNGIIDNSSTSSQPNGRYNDNNWGFNNMPLFADSTLQAVVTRGVQNGAITFSTSKPVTVFQLDPKNTKLAMTPAEQTDLAAYLNANISKFTVANIQAMPVGQLEMLNPINFATIYPSLTTTQINTLAGDPVGFKLVAAYLPTDMLKSMGYGATADIVSFNDYHGALDEAMSGTSPAATGNPGGAKLAGAIKDEVAKNPGNTIIVSGGDNYQGSAVSNINIGKPVNQMFKNLNVQYSAVGNHEFDWNTDLNTAIKNFEDWQADSGMKYLASNIVLKSDGSIPSFVQPYAVQTINGIKVGFVGVATQETPSIVSAKCVEAYNFLNPVKSAQPYIDQLKTPVGQTAKNGKPGLGCQVVIALTHLGSYDNTATGNLTGAQLNGVDELMNFANNTNGLDAIISGHSHQNVNAYASNADGKQIPVVQAYYNGRSVDKLRIIEDANGKFNVYPYLRMLSTAGVKTSLTPDTAVAQIITNANSALAPLLNSVVGVNGKGTAITDKSALPGWANQVVYNYILRTTATPSIVITNAGGWRDATPFGTTQDGTLTVRDLYNIMPFDNQLMTMDMKGSDLISMITGNLKVNSANALGSAPVVTGVSTTAPYTVTATGQAIDPNATYRVMTSDFTYTGGDNFGFPGHVSNVTILPSNLRDAMIDQLCYESKNSNPLDVKYTVTFDVQNGSAVDTKTVGLNGSIATAPTTSRAGYTFDGWYNGNNKVTFPYTVTGNVTLTAHWTINQSTVTPSPVDNKDSSKVVDAVKAAADKSTTLVDITSNTVVSKDVFTAIAGKDKTITFQKDGVTWIFNGLDIKPELIKDIDLSLKTVSADLKAKETAKAKAIVGKDVAIASFSFTYEGKLPGKADVKVFIGKDWANRTVNVLRYFADKNTYEVAQKDVAVDANGYMVFTTDHCSDYFVIDNTAISSDKLPQTGSAVDFTMVVDFGALIAALGAAVVIYDRRKKKVNA